METGAAREMQRSERMAFVFGALAALFWSPNYLALTHTVSREAPQAPLVVIQFYMLLWAAAAMLLVLFLSGRMDELAAFKRKETHFLVLVLSGGYGLWLLRALSIQRMDDGTNVRLLFYSAPLIVAVLGFLGAEKPSGKQIAALLLGFVGCIMIIGGPGRLGAQAASTEASGGFGGVPAAVGAAACFALFSLVARQLLAEEKVLPVAVVVLCGGALCLMVTCFSMGMGKDFFSITWKGLWLTVVFGVLTVGVTFALWLKCLAAVPAVSAAAFWYLGAVFGIWWSYRMAGVRPGWWALGGTVLVLLCLQGAARSRQKARTTLGDIIRG